MNKKFISVLIIMALCLSVSTAYAKQDSPAVTKTSTQQTVADAEPTATPTAEPTATPTAEPTATPTAEPTATPTAEPTATPTAEPTATPTAEPTATPTAEPTATPTAEPTAAPTAEPTATPTAAPTATPTAEPDGKGKVVKEVLKEKKKQRAEARIEAKELIKDLKTLFKDADVETKKEILKEIAQLKKELKDLSIGAFVRGLNVDFDKYDGVKPIIQDGRTLVPVRAIIEAFGANVVWESETNSITIKKGDTIIKMQIDNKIATVNGEQVELDVAPTILKDRTLVPIRFISESLKLNVEWDGDSQTIVIE